MTVLVLNGFLKYILIYISLFVIVTATDKKLHTNIGWLKRSIMAFTCSIPMFIEAIWL